MYAFWEYWAFAGKCTYDGIAKTITVNSEVTAVDIRADVYSGWIRWLELEQNTGFYQAMRYTGLDPIPGGFTGDSYFLINGWKFVVDLSKVEVSGVLFSDNYPTAFFTPSLNPQYPAKVSSLVNTVTIIQTQNVVTGDLSVIPTAAQNASAVRNNLTPELNKINAQVDGLTSIQQTMLLEIYRLYGLDPTEPLVVTNTSRVAGTINQTINSTTNQTTIQRV